MEYKVPDEAWILIRSGLKGIKPWLYCVIYTADKQIGGCIYTNDELAQILGKVSVEISRDLAKLIQLGLIRREFCNGRRTLTPLWCKMSDKDKSDLVKTLRDISYINNNEYNVNMSLSKDTKDVQSFASLREKLASLSHKPKQKKKSLRNVSVMDIDIERAKSLWDRLTIKDLKTWRSNFRDWPKYFACLREYDNIDDQEIGRVLSLYLPLIRCGMGKDYIPEAFCARTFMEKFRNIKECMNDRFGEPIQLDTCGRKAMESISKLRWPKGKASLEEAVQKSINNYRFFLEDFNSLVDRLKKNTVSLDTANSRLLSSFVEVIQSKLSGHPRDFAEMWFNKVHDERSSWEEWDGDLKREIFSVQCKRFQRMGREWSSEYCGSESCWKLFMEVL